MRWWIFGGVVLLSACSSEGASTARPEATEAEAEADVEAEADEGEGAAAPVDRAALLTQLRAQLAELAELEVDEPVRRWSNVDVSPLAGMTRDELRAALGTPESCADIGGAPCETEEDWFYAFFRLPPHARGGGPNVLLSFDADGVCTAARWQHTR